MERQTPPPSGVRRGGGGLAQESDQGVENIPQLGQDNNFQSNSLNKNENQIKINKILQKEPIGQQKNEKCKISKK